MFMLGSQYYSIIMLMVSDGLMFAMFSIRSAIALLFLREILIFYVHLILGKLRLIASL